MTKFLHAVKTFSIGLNLWPFVWKFQGWSGPDTINRNEYSLGAQVGPLTIGVEWEMVPA